MHQPVEEHEEPTRVTIPRYFIFVGCPGCPNCEDHPVRGWDSLASVANTLDEAEAGCFSIPPHLWWQLVDIVTGRVISEHYPSGKGPTVN